LPPRLSGHPPAGLFGQSGWMCPSFPQAWHIILGFIHSLLKCPRSPQLWQRIWLFDVNVFRLGGAPPALTLGLKLRFGVLRVGGTLLASVLALFSRLIWTNL
jgi:hypothetical protein